MITLADAAVAYRTEFGCDRPSCRPLEVTSRSLIVFFVERVKLGLQTRNVALGLLVVHPELYLVHLFADVPQLLFLDVAIRIWQAYTDLSRNNISIRRKSQHSSHWGIFDIRQGFIERSAKRFPGLA